LTSFLAAILYPVRTMDTALFEWVSVYAVRAYTTTDSAASYLHQFGSFLMLRTFFQDISQSWGRISKSSILALNLNASI